GIRESGFGIRRDSLDVNRFERESRIPNPEARPTRRDFLAASLLFPAALWPQSAAARFLATVPLGGVAGVPTTPLGTLLGSGLDARLFTDLSTIDPRDPKTFVTANDRYYIRTAAPTDLSGAQGFSRLFDLTPLERFSTRAGPYVMEC